MSQEQQFKQVIKVKDIIDRIQLQGYRVKMTHYRYFGVKLLRNADIHILLKALKIMASNNNYDPKSSGGLINNFGGKTEVTVIKGDVGYNAASNCSLSDTFRYGKAGRLALYRVLKNLLEEDLQTLRKEISNMYLKFIVQVKDNGKWEDLNRYEDKEIAEQEASDIKHNSGKETRVVEVFE